MGFKASLSVLEGESRSVVVTWRRLLTPLPKILLEAKSELVCSAEMTTEAAENWRIPFLDLLERGRLLDGPLKWVNIRT